MPRLRAPAVALLLSAGLLILGLPRFIAGLALAPHDAMLRDLRSYPEAVDSNLLALAIEDYASAEEWSPDSTTASELARFNYILALRFGLQSDLGRRHLVQALEEATQAVSRAPSSAFAWTYRALSLNLLQGMTPTTLAALEMAIDTAPFQPQLLAPRIALGLNAWAVLPDPVRAKLADQIFFAAAHMPKQLAVILESPSLYRLVRQIMADRPDLLQALDAYKN